MQSTLQQQRENVFDIEHAFVGGCFNGTALNADLSEVTTIVSPDMIQSGKLAAIYAACCRLFGRSHDARVVDEITVHGELSDAGELTHLGSTPQHELCKITTHGAWSGAVLIHYARGIVEQYKRRRLAELSRKVVASASNSGETIDQAEIEMRAIAMLGDEQKMERVSDALVPQMREIQRLFDAKKIEGLVKTGFYDLDDLCMGLLPGDFVLLGGRPSIGKTALALDVAANVAKTDPVGFFSLEMTRDALMGRLLAAESNVAGACITAPWTLSETAWPKLAAAMGRMQGTKLLICDEAKITTGQIRALIEKTMRSTPLKLIVVDYLQLIRAGSKAYSRDREVAEISADFKAIAKDFAIPVLCLAQLNRATETAGKDKRPRLSNLRESGSLEQDADKVLFVHREHYYDQTAPEAEGEILIAKNRTGPGAGERIFVGWDKTRTHFYNKARE